MVSRLAPEDGLLKISCATGISGPNPKVGDTILALSGRPILPEETNSAARRTAGLCRPCNPIAVWCERTARGGRDSIDHAPGAHDDAANAAAGVLVYLTSARHQPYQGPIFGTYVNGKIEMDDGSAGATGYARHPPEFWAAQGIFHPQDRQKWIDAGVWTPPKGTS
jgi:hypothetical protein